MRMQQVDVETLQEWLTGSRPVTVLDIRTPEDRAQWFIPGSIHVNAYDALKSGDPQALKGVDLPNDRPVVTICNAGKVSQIAAEQLYERGLEALSLAGGMKAWSLAWNTAETELEKATVLQVRRTGRLFAPGGGTWMDHPPCHRYARARRPSVAVEGPREGFRRDISAAVPEPRRLRIHSRTGRPGN
jgi:rhodanese-related sulfurtransferase